jgi:hypothetical protein
MGAMVPHPARKDLYRAPAYERSVDKRRVQRIFGRVSSEELRAIDRGLLLFLGLGAPSLR